MAVFTPLTQNDIEQLLGEYTLGHLVNFENIVEGVDNSNFKLTTSQGIFILTVFESRIEPSEIPYYLGLMQHFSATGIICPAPIPRRDDAVLSNIKNKPCAIFSFLKGRGVLKEDITPALCFELGACLGKMHIAGQSTNVHRKNSMGWDAWTLRLDKVQSSYPNAVLSFAERDAWTILSQEMESYHINWPVDLPQGNVHLDLFPNNVFIEDNHIAGIIDFYFSATDFLAYDLAIVMNAWCFEKGQLNGPRWDSLLLGYQSMRSLTPAEKESFQLLARAASMRFFSSRLHDLTFHDSSNLVVPHDPSEYWKILLFHINTRVF